jgi:hypothetical protein
VEPLDLVIRTRDEVRDVNLYLAMGLYVRIICTKFQSRGYFFSSAGDGDEGRNSPVDNLGRGTGKVPPPPLGLGTGQTKL